MKRVLIIPFILAASIPLAAQSVKVDSISVVVNIGGKSKIKISIGDPADIPAIRRYDVESLIDDLINEMQRSENIQQPELYRIDSLANQTRREVEESLEQMERDMAEMERDMADMEKDSNEWEMRRKDFDRLRRLSRLQARLAGEEVRRQLEKELAVQRRTLSRLRESGNGSYQKVAEEAAEAAVEALEEALRESERAIRDDQRERNRYELRGHGDSDEKPKRGTRNSFNIDFGTNNYLSSGKFIDGQNVPYTIRPLGSWYVAGNSTYRTRLANKLFLEWGGGLAFYNFKFQNDSIQIQKLNAGIDFVPDARGHDYIKSKLTAYYAQVFMVPVLDFGANRNKPGFLDDHRSSSFRIGFGPYAGYRLDSYTKQTFKKDGERERQRNHDNFYLNNLRYGLRLQVGFRDTELFVNYDLNELFIPGKGPTVNAFSFGITL